MLITQEGSVSGIVSYLLKVDLKSDLFLALIMVSNPYEQTLKIILL